MRRALCHALSLSLGLIFASGVQAQETRSGGISVDHPRIVASDPQSTDAIGTLTIRNETGETEKLTAIRGPFPVVTLRHRVEVGEEMRLVPVDRLAIPRSAEITLSAQALHVHFDALDGAGLTQGDRVTTTFVFENAGEMEVVFIVE